MTAIAVVTVAAFALGLPVETIGSKYGAIPRGFPAPVLPAFSWRSSAPSSPRP